MMKNTGKSFRVSRKEVVEMEIELLDNESIWIRSSTHHIIKVRADDMGELRTVDAQPNQKKADKTKEDTKKALTTEGQTKEETGGSFTSG